MAKCAKVVLDDEDNVPSAATVTTVRATFGDELLPAEGNTAVPSIAGSYINICFVGETEHYYSALASVTSTIEQYLRFFLSWNLTVPATSAKRV